MKDFQKRAAASTRNSKPTFQRSPSGASVHAPCCVVCLNPNLSNELRRPSEGPPSVRRSVSTLLDFTFSKETEPAPRLSKSAHALRYWRAPDDGPPGLRIGDRRIRYNLSALRAWIDRQAGVRDGR